MLSDAAIDSLARKRLNVLLASLCKLFPGFGGFPVGPQSALIDLGWNLGTGAHPGLAGWPKLRHACNLVPPDWQGAAEESHCATSRRERNDYRRACFLAALKPLS